MTDLATAVALVFVIEGALYALFPDAMKRAIARTLVLSAGSLRLAGLTASIFGVGLVWIIRG